MREYVTIIIAHHEGKPPKTLRIRKSYLKAFVVSAVSFCLLSAVSYALNWNFIYEREQLKAEAKNLSKKRNMSLPKRKDLLKRESL